MMNYGYCHVILSLCYIIKVCAGVELAIKMIT
jgi:hypothetical protein